MRRWIFPAIALALVALRSAVFLLRPESCFDSDQAIVLASEGPQRILLYNMPVAEHAAAVRLSRRRCDGGTQLIPGVYRCP